MKFFIALQPYVFRSRTNKRLGSITGKFKRALAIARVLVPVAVRSKDIEVFFLRARINDALAALFIERVVWSTIYVYKTNLTEQVFASHFLLVLKSMN